MKPMALMTAKTTTMIWESFPPRSWPKRVVIHSAPVITPERRSQTAMNTMTKIWFHTGQSQGIHTLCSP